MLDTHIVRLGTHAEKDYLSKAYAWFDETVLNANLVEGTASSLGVFLNELRDKGKNFFIDPVSYAFALTPDYIMKSTGERRGRNNIKRTFDGLAKRYGSVVDRYAGVRPLTPDDLGSQTEQDELCNCVLNYQKGRLDEGLAGSKEFLLDGDEIEDLIPTKFVAPYFHLSGDLEWLPINIALANCAIQIENETWIVICIDSLLLDSNTIIDKIITDYRPLNTPGFLLWATAFEEERATENQIRGLLHLTQELSQDGAKKVINMFGGYFSCLLAEYGLTGISHGLGYGERRDIVPVLGGGLPPAKYYLPPIHQQIRMDQFASIVSELDEESFQQNICNCVICTGLLMQGIDYLVQQYTDTNTKIVNGRIRQVATPLVYRLTRFHYLHNKNMEINRCNGLSRDALLSELDSAYNQFRGQLGSSTLNYLRNWQRTLSV